MSYSFHKSERLCSEKLISKLFGPDKKSLYRTPFRFSWIILDESQVTNCQVLILVSKRIFKNAVQRNKVKRVLRELYRLNKQPLLNKLIDKNVNIALMVGYNTNSLLDFKSLELIFKNALLDISKKFEKNIVIPIPFTDKDL